MSNPFVARTKNVGNVFKDVHDDTTYVMVQPEYGEYAMVSLFGTSRWQGPIERNDVFVDTVSGDKILEYIGRIESVNIKREIIQTEKVTK